VPRTVVRCQRVGQGPLVRRLTIGCRGCGALHAFGWMEVLRVGPAPLTLVSLGAAVQVSVRRTRRGDELSREEFPAEASMA
jgi:hypothetical protein